MNERPRGGLKAAGFKARSSPLDARLPDRLQELYAMNYLSTNFSFAQIRALSRENES